MNKKEITIKDLIRNLPMDFIDDITRLFRQRLYMQYSLYEEDQTSEIYRLAMFLDDEAILKAFAEVTLEKYDK